MTGSPLSRADIDVLFADLATELEARGVRAEIFLVGGAAIALGFGCSPPGSREEGLALVEQAYRGRPLPARIPFLLEEIVAGLDGE